MQFKFVLLLTFLLSFNLNATQSIEVLIKKTELVAADNNSKVKVLDIFTLNGMR